MVVAGDSTYAVLSYPLLESMAELGLTAAEREILPHVLRGDSNLELARRRGTSSRTVANQVASIFRKLGVSCRTELAARLAARQR
jgi:DNA-binding CsgD family transcriptional regulator